MGSRDLRVIYIHNSKSENDRVRNPKSKNDFVEVWAREEHFFVLKKIFSRNPTPHFYKLLCEKNT